MSTTLLIGRWPAVIRRAFSHSGEGPISTSSNTRTVNRGQSEKSSTDTESACSAAAPSPSAAASSAPGSGDSGRARDGVQLARHPVDAHAVGAVGVHLQLQHVVADRQVAARRLARLVGVRQHDDARRVGADLELRLRQDHAFGRHAPQIRAAELGAAGHDGARQRYEHRLPRRHVGRSADDRARVRARELHAADAEPIRLGMALGAEHLADPEVARVAVVGGHADARDALQLRAAHRQQPADLHRVEAGVAVLLQPGERDAHQNCSRKRMSFSKKRRRSGMPCFSIAIRSTPMPKAKPCTRSGS